jgi:uncharacterized protein
MRIIFIYMTMIRPQVCTLQATTQPITYEADADMSEIPGRLRKPRSRRSTFLKWLRNVHGWIGLWGAALGLLFGVTGILQNHRATMPIKVGGPAVSTIRVAVPTPPPKSPRELARYLQTELNLDRPAARATREPSQPVTWGDQSVIQPEHWTVRFIAPGYLVTADMWQGDALVIVERREQGLIGVLESLHRAQGAGVGWILLADSIGGAMILLSLTGVLLWTELNRRKTIGAAIFIASLVVATGVAIQSL